MDGTEVIVALLVANDGVTERVAADADPPRISADALGEGVELPAIRAFKVSGVDRQTLKAGARQRVTQRVQVEVHATTKREVKDVLALVRRACAPTIMTALGPLTRVVVLTDGEGPEGFSADTMARIETQDFKVSYNEEL